MRTLDPGETFAPRAELTLSAERLSREAPEFEELQLFGSFPRGDHTPGSDVDALSLVSRSAVPGAGRRLPDAFWAIPLDVNLAVYTVAEAARLHRDRSSFLARIALEARLLFLRDRLR